MRRLLSPGKIAIYLATAGEKWPYAIAKGTGLSHGRIGDAIPRLLKLGFIKGRELRKARTGLAVIGYSLTLKGLAEVLQDQPRLWEKIDIIASEHKKLLPLIFGKWDYFTKSKIRDFVILRLKHSFFLIAGASIHGIDMDRIPVEVLSPGKNIEERIAREILIPDFGDIPDALDDAITGDPELEKLVMSYLKPRYEMYLELAEGDKKRMKTIAQKRAYLVKTHYAPRSQGGEKERKKEEVKN
jgi:hypothetical protein